MMRASILTLAGLLALTACGEKSSNEQAPSGEEVADQLEEAADQSGPTAEKVLDRAADEARTHETMAPVDAPGSFAQEAMKKAGEAEASASPEPVPTK